LYVNLGNVLLAQGRPAEAGIAYRRAIELQPDYAEAHNNLGNVFRACGDGDAAVAAYRRALESSPARAEIHNNLGIVLADQGRHAEAEDAYRQALALQPDFPDAWNNLGGALSTGDKLEEGIEAYRRALALKPDFAEACYNLGAALALSGDFDGAIEAYRLAQRLNPAHASTWANLGLALRERGRLDEALITCRRAVELDPRLAEGHSNLATVLVDRGRLDEAEFEYRRALELRPDFLEALNNLGIVLKNKGRLDEAAEFYRRAMAANPSHLHAYFNMGVVWWYKARFVEAEASFREAIAHRADYAAAHLNLALLLLLLGRYEEGWREYEWRWKSPKEAYRVRNFRAPLWDGNPVPNRTLLIHSEQGLGDTLLLARYLPLICERSQAGRVILECPRALFPLLKQLETERLHIFARGASDEELPAFDLQAPFFSVPLLLQYFEPLVVNGPYLRADDGRRAGWRDRLGLQGRSRVGLAWTGSPSNDEDVKRSISPDKLTPLLQVAGVQFLSLQVEPRGPLPSALAQAGIDDFTMEITDFADSAALFAELDLIISVDTATAHLAGSLGRPVWVLLPLVPDWRWGCERSDTPWYPTMRLFRQSEARDWAEVVETVAGALSEWRERNTK
jgi:tetratricopeptide (TPR) repeat protein